MSEGDQAEWASGFGTLLAIAVTQRIASRADRLQQRQREGQTAISTMRFAILRLEQVEKWLNIIEDMVTEIEKPEWPVDEESGYRLEMPFDRTRLMEFLPDDGNVESYVVELCLNLIPGLAAWERAVIKYTQMSALGGELNYRLMILRVDKNALVAHLGVVHKSVADLRSVLLKWSSYKSPYCYDY